MNKLPIYNNRSNSIKTHKRSFRNPFKVIFSFLFGRLIGDFINIGQRKTSNKNTHLMQRFENDLKTFDSDFPQLEFKNTMLKTSKNVNLHTIYINHKNASTKNSNSKNRFPSDKPYIVVFPGNLDINEGRFKASCKLAKDLDCNIVSFDYRGKGGSTGTARNINEMVSDGIDQVRNLLDNGIIAENIILYGHCFGAGIATRVCSELHENNIKVYLFNDRSFSRLSDMSEVAVTTMLSKQKTNPGVFKKYINSLVAKTLKSLIKLSYWELDVAKYYNRIPMQYRDYLIVKSSKESKKRQPMIDDGLIPEEISLHKALKKERKLEKLKILSELTSVSKICNTSYGKPSPEFHTKELFLKSALNSYKERKMQGTPNPKNLSLLDIHGIHSINNFKNEIHKIIDKIVAIHGEAKLISSLETSPQNKKRENELKQEFIKLAFHFTGNTQLLKSTIQIPDLVDATKNAFTMLSQMYLKYSVIIENYPESLKNLSRKEFVNNFAHHLDVRNLSPMTLRSIGHYKELWELKSAHELTGADYFKKFITKVRMNKLNVLNNMQEISQ